MIEYSCVVPHEISDAILMKDSWLSKTSSQPDDFNKNSNKNADIKFSVHDVFLEKASAGTRTAKIFESLVIQKSLGTRKPKKRQLSVIFPLIPSRSVGLAAIVVIMYVTTFTTVVILYIPTLDKNHYKTKHPPNHFLQRVNK